MRFPCLLIENQRVAAWVDQYPKIAGKHKDSDGCHPKHTFYYPEEEYETDHLNQLAEVCRRGFGEVEIHLHHDNDSPEGLRKKIERFREQLKRHGLLPFDERGRLVYAFIHGNWALDNSRKDGRMCGVNNELEILKETGCYADFTFPSAPSETQTSKINSIYYAKETSEAKSHNTGIDVEVGRPSTGDLMLIQGPLTLNWKTRKWRVFPKIENGDITLEK